MASIDTTAAIQAAIDRHATLCGYAAEETSQRLRNLEVRFATLVGLMIGCGAIGGAVSGALVKLLP